jgi:hypothetical protein
LEVTFSSLESVQCVKELKVRVADLIRIPRELLRLLDRELYPINGHPRLIGHLEDECRGL